MTILSGGNHAPYVVRDRHLIVSWGASVRYNNCSLTYKEIMVFQCDGYTGDAQAGRVGEPGIGHGSFAVVFLTSRKQRWHDFRVNRI